MTEEKNLDDPFLSALTDAYFELPNLEWVDDETEDGDDVNKKELKDTTVEETDDGKPENSAILSSVRDSCREVLISLDNDRKKVIVLHVGEFDKIEQKLVESLKDDPSFEKYSNYHIIFQEFNTKFDTWVDFDKTKEVCDGAHLKAIFFRKSDAQSNSHRSSRRKEKKSKRKSADCDSRSRESRSHKRQKLENSDKFLLPCATDRDSLITKELYCGESSVTELVRFNSCPTVNIELNELEDSFIDSSSVVVYSSPTSTTSKTYSEPPRCSPVVEYSLPTSTTSKTYSELPKRSPFVKYPLPKSTTPKTFPELQRFTASEGELYYLSLAFKDKNPVSALHELCCKLNWGKPEFEVVAEGFPGSDAAFHMKVTIKGESFVPEAPSRTKKLAKTAAAQWALKALGILK